MNTLPQMIVGQYFGRASFGSIVGLLGAISTCFLGLGPTLGALMFEATDGYTALFSFALASYALAFLLVYMARPPRLPLRAMDHGDTGQA